MKIGVSIIFYNDLRSLKRCISSLKADTIYAIDGRFKDFNSPNPLSTDGSREFLQSVDNVVLIDAPDLSEVNKRDIPLKACKEDFLFIVDSDHWIKGDWNEFRKEIDEKVNEKNGYGYWFLTEDLSRNVSHYQLWGLYKPNQVSCKYSHDWYEAENERILPQSHNGKYTELFSLKVINDQSLRSSERIQSGKSWYKQSRVKEIENIKKIKKNYTYPKNFEKEYKFPKKLRRWLDRL